MFSDFQKMAGQAFAYLTQERGLNAEAIGDNELDFVDDDVRVRIVQSQLNGSDCLYVTLTLRGAGAGEKSREFTMGEIIRQQDPDNPAGRRVLQFSGGQELEQALQDAADEVRTYGLPLLNGEKDAFAGLASFRKTEIRSQMLDNRLTPVRRSALVAWAKQDYANVAKYYGSIETHLSRAERKKLAVARRKLKV